jgi:hypothetical protein
MAIRDLFELLALRQAQKESLPQQPQPAAPAGLGAIDNLFAPPVSPEKAMPLALLNAGLTLSASRGSTPEAVLQALQVGQGTYAAAQQAQTRQQLQELLASGAGPEEILQIARQLIAAGDVQSGKALIESLGDAGEPFTLSPGDTRFSPTGEEIASVPAEPDELTPRDVSPTETGWFDGQGNLVKTTRRIEDPSKMLEDITKLGNSFRAETRDQAAVASAFGRVQESGTDPSAAGDIALIFSFMKMVDPGSVVREGEFATAQNAGGIPDRTRALYNRLLNGERLSTPQRTDFVNRARRLAEASRRELRHIMDKFSQRALRTGVDPSDIVIDYFEPHAGAMTKRPAGVSQRAADYMEGKR